MATGSQTSISINVGRWRIPALPVGIAVSLAVHALGLAVFSQLSTRALPVDELAQIECALGAPMVVRTMPHPTDDDIERIRSLEHAPHDPVELKVISASIPLARQSPNVDVIQFDVPLLVQDSRSTPVMMEFSSVPAVVAAAPADAPAPTLQAPIPTTVDAAALPAPAFTSLALPSERVVDVQAASGVVTGVEVESLPRPAYPMRAIRRGLEGTARVVVDVRSDGTVDDVRLFESSGHAILDRAAIEAAESGRYRAAMRDGRRVRDTIVVPFEFRLID